MRRRKRDGRKRDRHHFSSKSNLIQDSEGNEENG
jgi:hypothetical protein